VGGGVQVEKFFGVVLVCVGLLGCCSLWQFVGLLQFMEV
jgi:hypothetical protein